MGLWSAYFFAKLLLFAGGYIGFNAWANLAFAAFTALPPQNPRQAFAKNLVAIPVGIVLLYHDSWLPPIERVWSQAQNLTAFTLEYVLELLGRFIDWRVLLQLVVLLAAYAIARRKLRLSTFVFISIFAVMLFPQGLTSMQSSIAEPHAGVRDPSRAMQPQVDPRNMRPEALDALLADFNAKESQKQVRFPSVSTEDEPFDIVFVHVCSLSWDDLQAVDRMNDPILKRFNIVFSRFNSAASYSGPAAIRLLRGSCGQSTHQQLYQPAARECMLFDGLQQAGFAPAWVMNHDGHFGDFFTDVHDRGAFPGEPDDLRGVRVAQHAFDGSPIYDDYSTLSKWWSKRTQDPARHAVLYYNSISLHDGNRVVGQSDSSYISRLGKFSKDMGRFLDDVERSGRKMIVVFVPEHGAAVRGDRRQIPGLREIPTPAITQIPVGVTLVNAQLPAEAVPERVEASMSYFGMSELLSRFVADNPFSKSNLRLSSYTQALPTTESVAENDGTVMMQIGRQYMMRTPDGAWSAWDTTR